MIVEWFLLVLQALLNGFFTLADTLTPGVPSWVQTGFTQAGQLYGYASTMGAWIPIPLAVTVASVVLITSIAAVTIRLIRMIISYFTFGGGVT